MTDKHQKHAFVPRPTTGHYFRNEWGLLGAPCSTIENLANEIMERLAGVVSMSYYDADHKPGNEEYSGIRTTDKIQFHRIDFEDRLNEFDIRIALGHVDIGLINSNHFDSSRQIVIIHSAKEDSLKRKLNRLSDIRLIVMDSDESEIYGFVNDQLGSRNVPVVNINQPQVIADFILNDWKQSLPVVNGLVLAGGQSRRMGEDKSLLQYHNVDQTTHMARMMNGLADKVYISLQGGQEKSFKGNYDVIRDSFIGLGPFGAIVSAMREQPDCAWLVVACDQPLLKAEHLGILIDERDPSKVATCFYNPETGFPEPLITLWEPKSYPRLLDFLSMGYSCPRKVLINSNVKVVEVDDTLFMKNANTPEEMESIKKVLETR